MLPIRRRLYQSQPGFTPRQLFSAMQGAWLEPTPGYIWQENTGVTPTTTGGQTIGLMLDQSQGAVLGPELISNGDFEQGDTWWSKGAAATITQVSGNWAARINNAANGQLQLFKSSVLTVGKVYNCTFTVLNYVSGRVRMNLNTGTTITPVSNGIYTIIFTANSATFGFVSLDTGATFDIDNVSCKEILGNHAYQSVSGSRPTYQES